MELNQTFGIKSGQMKSKIIDDEVATEEDFRLIKKWMK